MNCRHRGRVLSLHYCCGRFDRIVSKGRAAFSRRYESPEIDRVISYQARHLSSLLMSSSLRAEALAGSGLVVGPLWHFLAQSALIPER